MTDATPTPPPPPPEPTASTPAPVSPGAVKVREPIAVVLLTFVTLGIYFLYWTYQVFRELKETTREGIGPIIGLVIALVIAPVNWFVMPSEIGNMYAAQGKEKPVSGATGFWNLIPLIGTIIWIVKLQNALNRQWEAMGS